MEPRKLSVSTDYPQDKVLDSFSGSFSAGARIDEFTPRGTSSVISHNIGSWGLIIGSYSIDNSTWYPLGVTRAAIVSGRPTFQTQEVNAYCTDTDIGIVCTNYTSSSVTIYYAIQVISRD